MEEWRAIPGLLRYQVSDSGRAIGPHKKLLKCYPQGPYVAFKVPKPGGGQRNMYMHEAVARAFIGPRPAGQEVCHCDGNPMNNEAPNLRYDSPRENNSDKAAHGTKMVGEAVNGAKLKEAQVLEIRARAMAGERTSALAEEFGVKPPIISQIKAGTRWKYLW